MEWLSYVSLVTGTIGAALGIRAEIWRRKEFATKQEDRENVESEKQRECIIAARNILSAARAIPLKEVDDLLTQDAEKVKEAILKLAKMLETESPKVAKTSAHLLPALYELPYLCDLIIQHISTDVLKRTPVSAEFAYIVHEFWSHLWEISLLPVVSGAKGGPVCSLTAIEKDAEVADLAARRENYFKHHLKHLFDRTNQQLLESR